MFTCLRHALTTCLHLLPVLLIRTTLKITEPKPPLEGSLILVTYTEKQKKLLFTSFLHPETVARRRFIRNVFLKISKNS